MTKEEKIKLATDFGISFLSIYGALTIKDDIMECIKLSKKKKVTKKLMKDLNKMKTQLEKELEKEIKL